MSNGPSSVVELRCHLQGRMERVVRHFDRLALAPSGLALPGPIILGLVLGGVFPVLAVLLYATFVQVPLLHVRSVFRDGRFTAAIVLGNLVLLPLPVWGLPRLLRAEPALRE